jgi:uncharacterized iron-regulated membrane protein
MPSRRAQRARPRTVVVTIHRWVGLAAALYLVVVGVTGATLVFRQDLQSAAYPAFFHADRGDERYATPSIVMRELRSAYPQYRLSGIDWPTYRRDTFLAYLSRGGELRTVFAHPVSGRVIGELPFDWIRWLQELHLNLLGGPTGRMINGAGALCLLVMSVTGLILWWRGAGRWGRVIRVDVRSGWRRTLWELHGALGVWAWGFLVMWALTGMYFAFPQPFRGAVHALSPLAQLRAPESRGAAPAPVPPVQPEMLLVRAEREVAGARVARLVLPFDERGTFLVVMARAIHGDFDTSDEVALYFDRYTGELLQRRDAAHRTAGDTVISWIARAHAGWFGGAPVKSLWAVLGFALPVLAASGVLVWWNRGRA